MFEVVGWVAEGGGGSDWVVMEDCEGMVIVRGRQWVAEGGELVAKGGGLVVILGG